MPHGHRGGQPATEGVATGSAGNGGVCNYRATIDTLVQLGFDIARARDAIAATEFEGVGPAATWLVSGGLPMDQELPAGGVAAAAEWHAAAVERLFKRADADGDGYLSSAEYRRLLLATAVWAHASHYSPNRWPVTWSAVCNQLGADAQLGVSLAGLRQRYKMQGGGLGRLLPAHLRQVERQAAVRLALRPRPPPSCCACHTPPSTLRSLPSNCVPAVCSLTASSRAG